MHRASAHRRRSSRSLALVVTGSLALLPVGATSAAASAQPSDWWWDTYGIQALHDEGWTGSGVKIAVLDDAINPDLPVFAGADLTIADGALCADKSTAVSAEATSGAVHGTTITASLIGSGEGAGAVRGIAPDADVTFYGLGRATDDDVCDGADPAGQLSPIGVGLKRAIDDGAQIVTSSVGAPLPDGGGGDADVIAEAVAKGVIFVNGTGNPSQAGQLGEFALEGLNGIVAATAVDRTGNLQQNEDGTPYIVPQTTVVAAGVGLPTVGRTGGTWDDSVSATGSSFAAPLVAGMLALAAQKYPDATGNQLVQSLLHTTDGETHEPSRDPSDGYGFGAAWPASLLAQDPSGYPDASPLLTDPAGMPTAEMVAAAAQDAPGDSATAAPTDEAEPSAPAGGMLPVLIIVLILLVVVVVGAVITIVIVVSRKNRTTGGGTP